MPRGVFFVAGVLGESRGSQMVQKPAQPNNGIGLLMEWRFGDQTVCTSAQIAHSSPIVSMVYGPYDNGPLVTADARGIFRIWETLLDSGLRFSQQIELLCAPKGEIAVCVEQPRGLYVAASGKRLLVWQRYHDENGRN